MSSALVTADNESKAAIAEFRRVFIDDLPDLAREYIDTARAEKTTAAMEKVMNTALKVIEGLQVDQAKNPYANLPVINFHIGSDTTVTTSVEQPALVEDVTPRRVVSPFQTSAAKAWDETTPESLPADPLDLLNDLDVAFSALPED